jgi:hypothetical protein
MAVKYSKWSENITTFFIPRPCKFYQNWDFWFENKQSGNTALHEQLNTEKLHTYVPRVNLINPYLQIET